MSVNESSWLADGVKEIERITKASMIVKPEIVNLPQERPGVYGVIVPGPAGSLMEIKKLLADPLWHNERLDDPTQLIAFINSMEARKVKAVDGAVYISETHIMYVYSFEDRRHRAICPLTISEPWAWLSKAQPPLSQKELVRALRITFDGALNRDSNLINIIRKVKWRADNTVDVDVQRGREALGAQIMREATGIADFPEEFILNVPVFENVKQTVTVRVALEVNMDVCKFEVIPFPNQIADGMAQTLGWLQTDIAATKVPTFIGAVRNDTKDA